MPRVARLLSFLPNPALVLYHSMRILGFDPGKINFGYAVLDDGKLLENGFLRPMEDLSFDAFDDHVAHLIFEHQPDAVIMERFMIRGSRTTGAVSAESVNLMIGRLTKICADYNIPWYLITAAQWKNYIKKHAPPAFPIKNVHQLDACHMAWYAETYWIEKSAAGKR